MYREIQEYEQRARAAEVLISQLRASVEVAGQQQLGDMQLRY